MRKSQIIFLIFMIMSLISTLLGQEVLECIVAIVGDKAILKSELMSTSQAIALQYGIDPNTEPEKFKRLTRSVLENMINENVLLAKAEEDTITVDDQTVEKELDARIQSFIDQLGSKEKVEKYFGESVNKIKRDYREVIKNQLIVQKVQSRRLMEVQISRREVEQFFNAIKDSLPEIGRQVNLRHILLAFKPGTKARDYALERMREIRKRIENGESFEKLAAQFSEDPATASDGGDLGFIERGTLFQSFEEAAFRLSRPGEISEIVESPVGLHLIKLVEKRGNRVHVKHILIRLSVTDVDESEIYNKILELRNRALAGEDFGALASEFSDDPDTKDSGGSLGWQLVDDFQIKEFKDAVDTLKEGEISLPFKTKFGYHIVKVEGIREKRRYSLKEDWEQIKGFALQRKRQKVLGEWLQELRNNIYIDIKEDLL